MNITPRIRDWIRRLTRRRSSTTPRDGLREFIYLDDISVYSLLASRKRGIATEFSESQTASLNSETGGSVDVGFGVAKAKLDAKMQAGQVQGSQVLRKATIQTSFKELRDIEGDALRLRRPDADTMPKIDTTAELAKRLNSPLRDEWVVDPSTIRRGELLEVDVELEAEPIYRLVTVITTLCELVEDNERFLQQAVTAQIAELRWMVQVLESMLVGLVPIRGRLVDYECAIIDDRDALIRRPLLDQLPADVRLVTRPAFVVGVAQRDLFWKDIRRVLFSKARHTVFCRLATDGLTDKWNPVKVADVLAGIVPSFDEAIKKLTEQAQLAMTMAPVEISATALGNKPQYGQVALNEYAALLAKHHRRDLTPDVLDDLLLDIPQAKNWLETVDGQRPVFAEVRSRVDTALEVKTSPEAAHDLRREALVKAGLVGILAPQSSSGADGEPSHVVPSERYLNTEIIAIYW